jgi:xeroderma pigmentosum group C-complementing protein
MYDEMLDEALSSSSTKLGRGEKIKRRRIGGRIITRGGGNSAPISPPMPRETIVDNQDENSSPSLVRQMAYTESDESSEDDVEWEDVLPVGEATISPTHSTPGSLDLVLEVGTSQPLGKPAPARRKVLTAAERSARLSTHKLHLLCALVHLSLRNCWCNDPDVRVCLPTKTHISRWLRFV